MARNMCPGPDWVPAVVIERLGHLTYLVETTDHLLWKRHINLLRELKVKSQAETPQSTESDSSAYSFRFLPFPWVHLLKKSLLHLSPSSEQQPRYCP